MLQQASAFMNNSNLLLIDRQTQQQQQQKLLTFSLVVIARNSGRTTVVIYINIISIKSIHELNIVEQNARFWMPKRQQKTKMSLTALISWSFELQSEQMSFESFGDWNLFRAGNSINFECSSGVRGFGPLKSEWIVYWNGQEFAVGRGWKGHREVQEYWTWFIVKFCRKKW